MEQTRDGVLRHGEPVGRELLNVVDIVSTAPLVRHVVAISVHRGGSTVRDRVVKNA
ncbi:MAG: hypothetical protein WCQ77_12465 [Planctomycetota bacterium]